MTQGTSHRVARGRLAATAWKSGIAAGAAVLLLTYISPVSAAFRESLWGARPAGLGGAFSALADDANAPAHNPAGIALLEHNELTLMYAQLFAGLDLYAGDDRSRLGLGYFGFTPQIAEKRYGSYAVGWTQFTATHLYREDVFIFSVAESFRFDGIGDGPVLAAGANLKLLRRAFTLDVYSAGDPVFAGGKDSQAVSLDAGMILMPRFGTLPGLRFAVVAQDFTEPNIGLFTRDRIPARYTLGAAYSDPAHPLLNPTLDISRRGGHTTVGLGWEAWFAERTLALRAGGDTDQIGGGMGYQLLLPAGPALRFDYALLWPLNVEGTDGSHRISMTVKF